MKLLLKNGQEIETKNIKSLQKYGNRAIKISLMGGIVVIQEYSSKEQRDYDITNFFKVYKKEMDEQR